MPFLAADSVAFWVCQYLHRLAFGYEQGRQPIEDCVVAEQPAANRVDFVAPLWQIALLELLVDDPELVAGFEPGMRGVRLSDALQSASSDFAWLSDFAASFGVIRVLRLACFPVVVLYHVVDVFLLMSLPRIVFIIL